MWVQTTTPHTLTHQPPFPIHTCTHILYWTDRLIHYQLVSFFSTISRWQIQGVCLPPIPKAIHQSAPTHFLVSESRLELIPFLMINLSTNLPLSLWLISAGTYPLLCNESKLELNRFLVIHLSGNLLFTLWWISTWRSPFLGNNLN